MRIDGARVLVAGATGVIGAAVAAELHARGAHLVLAGRDEERLAQVSAALGGAPTTLFEAYDLDSCARAVHTAAGVTGRLDAVLTAFGSVAFGRADAVGDVVAEHLMTVNALAPAAFLRAALGVLEARGGGTIAALTGVVAERPQPAMADYSASKAALGAWLDAVRREARPAHIRVLDLRLGHLDTGFADRAVAGTPPPLPRSGDLRAAVQAVADALATDAELVRAGTDGVPVLQRRAR
ncbi:SDR family NAD(P)-dependent oxidoreductase [Streptomyces fulvorobeus]|uniref:Short-subunit dehydrogenase n=1 Tax=Streptomyces fulvorobeus TaxID=284028 RepID=A0A7J0BYP3_9ACTN|nr:SDR family NAD(P)-dependent oxidoreductase [Streptomyces fulvorobeus]NYE39140.1 short-subunit dehydrogenase [Streptomyces fulvorobeus]GFM95341.1 hypothetical protein Sfulv_01520 [Streptomyces fulvorobeus]